MAVVVIKWSANLTSTPTIRFRILLKSTVFIIYLKLLEKNQNKQKESGDGPFLSSDVNVFETCYRPLGY